MFVLHTSFIVTLIILIDDVDCLPRRSFPLKNLLSECKASMSQSPGCQNYLVRIYLFFCGRKLTVYQGLVILGLSAFEVFRESKGLDLLYQLMTVIAFTAASIYMLTFASRGESACFMLDESLWVADLVERNTPGKVEKRNTNIARISRFYFWLTLSMTLLTLVSMVPPVFLEGSTLMPAPLPDAESFGELPAKIVRYGMAFWQFVYCALAGCTYAWVDGVYFGTVLVIYALTMTLAQSIREVDYSQKLDVQNLIRAHQILLDLADFCNTCMSATNCCLVFVSVYLCVITGYGFIAGNAPLDRMLDMFITAFSVIRFGYLSELMTEASTDISVAVYESAWVQASFSKEVSLPSLRNWVLGVSRRSLKPMCLRVSFMGVFGNQFSLKYCRALYTYFQSLEKLL